MWRRAWMHWVVVWAAGFAACAASAQTPAAAPAPDAPAPAIVSEALETPAFTQRPTRRPTRRPSATPTDTATLSDTETPTAAPPTATPTRRPPATAIATATAVAALPTATRAAVPLSFGRDSGNVLPLLIGGGLTLLGVLVGALVAGANAGAIRRRARTTLATAMLLELRRMDAVLRRVVALDNPASFPALDHPIMEAALRDLTLFRTDTAARIAQFHGALRGIQHEIGDYRDNPLRWAGRLGELNQLIKGRAAAACRAVPELLRALEREGGVPPPQLHDTPASRASSPSGLPPPPFGESDADDWTL